MKKPTKATQAPAEAPQTDRPVMVPVWPPTRATVHADAPGELRTPPEQKALDVAAPVQAGAQQAEDERRQQDRLATINGDATICALRAEKDSAAREVTAAWAEACALAGVGPEAAGLVAFRVQRTARLTAAWGELRDVLQALNARRRELTES